MSLKDQNAILKKLNIDALNDMQVQAHEAIAQESEVVLLSPTGTGKTLAFLLPILEELDPKMNEVQALVLAPSRELAMQIEQVAREMGSGFKINTAYGGRKIARDLEELAHPPAMLIGTPGRIADHLRRETFSSRFISVLVLDEFDKSLETGFEKEMKEIVSYLPGLDKKILTSATQKLDIPKFVGLKAPHFLDFLEQGNKQLSLKLVNAPNKDKLETLANLLGHVGNASGIVFCNFKDSIQYVSDFLNNKKISHTTFYGGMEQQDRERALIQFRNGTHKILLATDLAARGIDVPEMDYIIHYQLPPRAEEFTHRNGRTARMHAQGVAYILKWENDELYDFIKGAEVLSIETDKVPYKGYWRTIYVSGGRKDKISKGDIVGFFMKQGKLKKDELGIIEVKQDCSFVAVSKQKAHELVKTLNNSRLKKRKVRITQLD